MYFLNIWLQFIFKLSFMESVLLFQPSSSSRQYCEVGTKKVFPFYRHSFMSQFYREVYLECLLLWFLIFTWVIVKCLLPGAAAAVGRVFEGALVFVGDGALQGEFDFSFQGIFCWYWHEFIFVGELGTRV